MYLMLQTGNRLFFKIKLDMNEQRPDFKLLTEQKKTFEDITPDEQFFPPFFYRPKKLID